jgi:hypothetical protein
LFYLRNYFFVLNFVFNAEHNEDFPAELSFEVTKGLLHASCNRKITEAGVSSNRFDLKAKCFIANLPDKINVSGMVEIRIRFFKYDIRKLLIKGTLIKGTLVLKQLTGPGLETHKSKVSSLHYDSFESIFRTTECFPESEEISTPPPCGLLIRIYRFYKNWSTESFFQKESQISVTR